MRRADPAPRTLVLFMSAFNSATLVLFPALGLVALAIGLLARRYSTPALGVGLTGLLVLTSASTWITSAGPAMDTQLIGTLNGEISKLKSEQDALRTELDSARRRPTQSQLDEAQRTAAVAIAQATEMAGHRRGLQRDLDAEKDKHADAQRRTTIAEARLVELGREAQGRRTQEAPPPPNPEIIRRRLIAGDRQHYTVDDERQLISGYKGNWYVVRLLQRSRPLTFADRQFVLTDASGIKDSIVRLREDVLAQLPLTAKQWKVFVRGTADQRRVAGPVGRELSYLPRLPSGTHESATKGKLVAVPVQNEDLPTLRADWLREIIRPVMGSLGTADIEILENPPQQGQGRTAELVLYVEWL